MILLAGAADTLGFAFLLMVTATVPTAGLIVSGLSLRKRGMNPWCGWAGIIFFTALLVDLVTLALAKRGGITDKIALMMILGSAGGHALGSLVALRGLAMSRTRKKWLHGRQRATWFFWLNVLVVTIIGLWCFAHVNETLYYRLQSSD